MKLDRFDSERALSGLKDFQRDTVDYVFQRMWLDENPATRFLVADEVGLGKTLVARGVIAKTVEHLRRSVERIDVVYVCSNAAIAQQNVNRLNVMEDEHVAMATRLTLLPLELDRLAGNRVNFVSFTPGTTFDLKSRGGRWEERVLLHWLLAPELREHSHALLNVLRGTVTFQNFRHRVSQRGQTVNQDLRRRFVEHVCGDVALMERLHDVCDRFREYRPSIPHEDKSLQYELIGDLRHRLARVCVDALEPDLVILDEFQRFRDLLDGDSDSARLARSLMKYTTPEGHDVRVLLLSATPYKAVTYSGEAEDHYSDFLRTVGFLFGDAAKVAVLEEALRVYRRGLYAQDQDGDLTLARDQIERMLRSVMVRTERVGSTAGRDAMLASRCPTARLTGEDLERARLLDVVAREVEAQDTIEYWKSTPYALEFMKDYQLRRKLDDVAKKPPAAVVEAVRSRRPRALSRKRIARYRDVEIGNGRLRVLVEEMIDKGQWQLLWMPPLLPYLQPGGAYADVPDFTKALVFSAWNVVPDAISAVCSYDVERRMVRSSGGSPPDYRRLHRSRSPLLRLADTKGRATGMNALALMYPSVALSRGFDPLRLSLEIGRGEPAQLPDVRRHVGERVEEMLVATGLWPRPGDGPPDQRWYWAALAILDRPHLTGLRKWMKSSRGWFAALSTADEDRALRSHIDQFREAADGSLDPELGPSPEDLVAVLTDLALAGPAICAARALRRVGPELEFGDRSLCHAAAEIAAGFRTLFNLPETISLLRGDDEDAYWRLVLQHGVDGNLQSVLDEYVHQLRESLGLFEHSPTEVVDGVADAVASALSLRTAPIAADELVVSRAGNLRFKRFRLRTRYALRFGDLRDDQDKTLARADVVRSAFNSPFRPFILSTTSVGQEGLDFHPYCHAVYHWNLPSNPVDLEQREGRVHRYKGHAVRKNVARKFGLVELLRRLEDGDDPWKQLFDAAAEDRAQGANELQPYWIYEIPGGARVERRMPMFSFSREVGKLERLRKGLVVYRLVLGQPRQEDLMEFLESDHNLAGYAIDLRPRRS